MRSDVRADAPAGKAPCRGRTSDGGLRHEQETVPSALPRVRMLSYVKDVSALLDSADLYLTKPGGISVTEAAEKRLPMILIDTVAGCEDYNLQFFVNLGAAKTADSEEAIAALCLDTLRSDDALCEMSAAYDRREAANGARYICDILDPPQKAEGE